jgi:hypothetical protein
MAEAKATYETPRGERWAKNKANTCEASVSPISIYRYTRLYIISVRQSPGVVLHSLDRYGRSRYRYTMPPDFFDPTPEQQNVVLIDAATLHKRSG